MSDDAPESAGHPPPIPENPQVRLWKERVEWVRRVRFQGDLLELPELIRVMRAEKVHKPTLAVTWSKRLLHLFTALALTALWLIGGAIGLFAGLFSVGGCLICVVACVVDWCIAVNDDVVKSYCSCAESSYVACSTEARCVPIKCYISEHSVRGTVLVYVDATAPTNRRVSGKYNIYKEGSAIAACIGR